MHLLLSHVYMDEKLLSKNVTDVARKLYRCNHGQMPGGPGIKSCHWVLPNHFFFFGGGGGGGGEGKKKSLLVFFVVF